MTSFLHIKYWGKQAVREQTLSVRTVIKRDLPKKTGRPVACVSVSDGAVTPGLDFRYYEIHPQRPRYFSIYLGRKEFFEPISNDWPWGNHRALLKIALDTKMCHTCNPMVTLRSFRTPKVPVGTYPGLVTCG